MSDLIFYRICAEKYSRELKASGMPNRWNLKNEFVIYAGSTRSLSTLEMVVHRSAILPSQAYKIVVISIQDFESCSQELRLEDLPATWNKFEKLGFTQQLGSDWYQSKKSLVLKVPSAIIQQESNIMINSSHPDFAQKVKISLLEDYFWDDRLL